MRVFINGRGAHPALTTSGGVQALHAWTFAQGVSSAALHDMVESGQQSLPVSGVPAVTGDSPIEWGRYLDGTSYFAGTANGADALALSMANAWSISAWVRPDAGLSSQAYVMAYGGNGTSLGTNHLLSFAVNSNYTVQTYWESAAGGYIVTASTATLRPAAWTHVTWVYSAGTLKLYLNGVLSQSWAGLTAPACAASGNTQRWVVGAVADSLGSKFKGSISSLVVWPETLSAADVLDGFRRGMGWHYGATLHACVRVQDGSADPADPDTFTDVSDINGRDWLNEVSLRDDADSRGVAGSVRLWREMGTASLAKLNDNKLNRSPLTGTGPGDTTYSTSTEFVADDRRVQVYLTRIPWGLPRPASGDRDWQLVLDGVINKVDWAGETVTLDVQDRVIKRLSRAWFEQPTQYGTVTSSTAVEDVMQSVLDDAYANGWVAADPDTLGAVSLYTPQSPGWMIGGYKQSRMSLMDVLAERADQIGWVVRRVWDPGTLTFRLTFMEPERTRTDPVAQLGPGDYYDVSRMEIDPSRIRTAVRVQWWSNEVAVPASGVSVPSGYTRTAGGTDGSATPDSQVTEHWVEWRNDAAETLHGRTFMEIAEASTSNINRVDEADRMALGALRDLAEPLAEQSVNAYPFPELEVGDLLRWTANQHHYTADQDLAVVTLSLSLSPGRSDMDIGCRGKPCGSQTRALQKDPRYGFHPGPTTNAEHVTAGLSISRLRDTSWHLANSTRMLRGGRSATLVNGDFQGSIWGPGVPPNAWSIETGTWGSDALYDPTTSLSGRAALRLASASGSLSQTLPVQAGKVYQAEMVWSASSINSAQLVAYWYQADGTTASATASSTVINDATGTTWITSRARVTVPSDARWCKLVVQRSAGASSVWVDRVGITRAMPAFSAASNLTTSLMNKTSRPPPAGTNRVQFNSESFDLGGVHDPASGRFTAPEDGIYALKASVGIKPGGSGTVTAQAFLFRNGTVWQDGPPVQNVVRGTSAAVATVEADGVSLSAGDYVDVQVYVDDGSSIIGPTLSGSVRETRFSGRLVPNE